MPHTHVGDEKVTRNNFFLVNPHSITVRADRNLSRGGVEQTPESIVTLAESMAPREAEGSGQIQPIIVRPIGNDQYECVAGYRRLAAAKYLVDSGRCTDYKIKYVVMRLNDAEAALLNLTENMEREEPNPIQLAHAIRSLNEDYGMSFKDIAAKLKRSATTIANMVDLVSLPAAIQARVSDRTITVGAAKELAKLPAETIITVVDAAGQDGKPITPKRVKAANAKVKADAGVAEDTPRTAKEIRTYYADRSPVSATERKAIAMMLGFIDGEISVEAMDEFWSEHYDNYRGESLDGDEDRILSITEVL